MPLPPLSRDEVREIDRRAVEEYGIPDVVLMENAGAEIARRLRQLRPTGPVVVCCGKGNNGGDGFVIARHLENHDVEVRVLLFADPAEINGSAETNLHVLQQAGTPLIHFVDDVDPSAVAGELRTAEWIVDALLGTGTRGQVRSPFDGVIETINAQPAHKLAVDLPSGLDCDEGRPLGPTVRADRTFTMVAPKLGFDAPEAADYLGTVEVVDIGVPRRLLDEFGNR